MFYNSIVIGWLNYDGVEQETTHYFITVCKNCIYNQIISEFPKFSNYTI